MVKKINIVTKRLVDHNEQIRKQNLRISDQERIYVDIKSVSKHLPGLETPEEKRYYEVLLEAKKEQLAALKHEIYANEAQSGFFKTQLAQLTKRMEELKKEYFRKKQAEICQKTGNRDKICWQKKLREIKNGTCDSDPNVSQVVSIVVEGYDDSEWKGEGNPELEYVNNSEMSVSKNVTEVEGEQEYDVAEE